MTRWLVTGAGGMLGRELLTVLAADPGARVTAASRATLDITDANAVTAAVAGHDLVVNAAAWTDVNGAEAHEAEAVAVNGRAVATLATACAANGARLIHVSTDYVFPGDTATPYAENAPTRPINAYGRSKRAGEEAVAALLPETGHVVRTAWLYGRHGKNFVSTILSRAAAGRTLRVVDDQHGQPTWAAALAERLVELGRRAHAGHAPGGVYHGTAAGRATWFDLARAAVELAGLDPDLVTRGSTRDHAGPAPRPPFSVLAHDRWAAAGLPPMAHWRDMLTTALSGPFPGRPAPDPERHVSTGIGREARS
ncbi:dTDP-4-dehydrorhamnose reductase [Streptomyces litchfieldiae]|uniref:dTDP-4-dehydrorhamnose reductase n=1 Tax=Streptomyces litchfieldiae TaxID=3075543 RepID=A0ABU2MXM5_9ACTN|nr:dTDP-4-dehydrorhamnose reductase [Streptomyces sp. DSM 44938]MDT0346417.1 dTDP-4-dehydrorhamnose reductase [Streptomyces sp. DSM 44938]